MIDPGSVTVGTYKNLMEAYRRQSFVQPDKVVYRYLAGSVFDSEKTIEVTYEELDRRIRNIAHLLQTRNACGKRVVLVYSSGIEYVEAYFACLFSGAIAVPAYPPNASRFFFPRLDHMIKNSGAEIALSTTETIQSLQVSQPDLVNGFNLEWVSTDNLSEYYSDLWVEPDLNEDTVAFLQYTSGSTSTPKGVIVTHGNLLHNINVIGDCFKPLMKEGLSDINGVTWLPPYHDMGLIGGILALPFFGFTANLMSTTAFVKKPLRWLEALSYFKSQISAAPNFAFDYCLKHIPAEEEAKLDLSHMRIIFNGAEPINYRSIERFNERFSVSGLRNEVIYPCYGLAESSLIVTGGPMDASPTVKAFNKKSLENGLIEEVSIDMPDARSLVGCGSELSDGKVVIVSPETMTACRDNEPGEIWIQSPSVAPGYWEEDAKTKETFQAYIEPDHEGPYLRTGDLGFLYNNELFITGRLKDLIIIQGRNISPTDVERVAENSHLAFRKNSNAAVSVEIDKQEELVVIQEVDKKYMKQMNTDELISAIRNAVEEEFNLNPYEVVLIRSGTIKKTSSGKIQRHTCREVYLDNSLDTITTF